MHTSVLHEMPSQCFSGQSGVDDLRAMQQVAMELSLLGLSDSSEIQNHNANHRGSANGMQASSNTHSYDNSPISEDNMNGNNMLYPNCKGSSSNTTECVPVPSSEHVAEIVGRQGCKIKALRAKTNTYIKTPVRGQEPVFVVTGRKQDVMSAKQEIMSAAEHFSQIRATRRQNSASSTESGLSPPCPSTPGQITIEVRVPYRVVGLVVGPKGATIKRIQQTTHTYIVTPSREKDPVFEVMGSPDCVEKARKEIESHIAMRTGTLSDSSPSGSLGQSLLGMADGLTDFHRNGIDQGFHDLSPYQQSLVKHTNNTSDNPMFTYPSLMSNDNKMLTSSGNAYSSTFNNNLNGSNSSSGSSGFGLYESSDEGIGSPSYGDLTPLRSSTSLWSDPQSTAPHPLSALYSTPMSSTGSTGSSIMATRRSNSLDGCTPRLSPDTTSIAVSGGPDHSSVRRIRSDPMTQDGGLAGLAASLACMPHQHVPQPQGSLSSGCSSTASSPTENLTHRATPPSRSAATPPQYCVVCSEAQVAAALVPCGHNFFCMECANNVVEKVNLQERCCPVCMQPANQAVRIIGL